MTKILTAIWGTLLLTSTQVWAAGDKAAHGDAHSDGHHGEAAEGLPQFDPSSFPSQIFWLVVTFVFLYIFFSKKTLPDISRVIENRQAHIQGDLDMAEQLKSEAEKVHQAYEEILDEARQKSTSSFDEVDALIKEKTDAASEDFRKTSAKELEKTEKSVEKAKQKVMGEMDSMVAELASQAAEKIIGVKADVKKAEKLVQSLQGKKKAA